MDATPASARDALARARQMHDDRVPIKEIGAAIGLSDLELVRALAGGPAMAAESTAAPIPPAEGIRRQSPPSPRAAIVAMLWESAERQVADIHKRVLAAGLEPDERERDGRMLAVVVKTLRELAALDDKTMVGHDDKTDEPDTRNIDEFRRELARRIDALVAGQSEAPDRDAAEQ